MRLTISIHAAERYRERIDPSLTVAQAGRLLDEQAHLARPLGLCRPRGGWLYELPGPPCALLLVSEGCVVTVFNPDDPPSAEDPDLPVAPRLRGVSAAEARSGV